MLGICHSSVNGIMASIAFRAGYSAIPADSVRSDQRFIREAFPDINEEGISRPGRSASCGISRFTELRGTPDVTFVSFVFFWVFDIITMPLARARFLGLEELDGCGMARSRSESTIPRN